MKHILLIALLLIGYSSEAQTTKIGLQNAMVIGQLDNPQDRYSLEVMLTELFTSYGIKSLPSVNMVKLGGDIQVLCTDSLQNAVKNKGVDTYVLVTVRGYDRKFRASELRPTLSEKLDQSSLFELYRQDAVSVSFEFYFYRNGQFVGNDLIKCGNVSDRESVLKRLSKKLKKKLLKTWR